MSAREDLKDTIVATLLMSEISDASAVMAALEAVAAFAYETGIVETGDNAIFATAANTAFLDVMVVKALEEPSRG